MKRILLSLLACNICAGILAQKEISKKNTEVSDKWEITTDVKIKKGLGRLDMNFPDSVYWWIIIYDQNDKMVKSFYPHEKIKSYNLPPGQYRIELSNVKVENVPIEAGRAIRLRSGPAIIESADYWQLYDASKENFFTSSSLFDGTAYRLFEASQKNSKPGNRRILKLALPVGNYQLKEGENYKLVEIKDKIIAKENTGVTETDKWIITEPDDPPAESKGRLNTQFPHSSPGEMWSCSWQIYAAKENNNQPLYGVTFYPGNSLHSDLDTGFYFIKLNDVIIKHVPIKAGLETRIKAGMIGMSGNFIGYWNLLDSSKHLYKVNFSKGFAESSVPFFVKVSVPAGSYIILYSEHQDWGIGGNVLYYPIVIKDGAWIDISEYIKTVPPSGSDTWDLNRILGNNAGAGRLNLDFPADADWDIKIYQKNKKIPLASYNKNSKVKTKSNILSPITYTNLPPGKYDISLAGVLITDVLIYQGYETRLRSGILNITSGGDWALYHSTPNIAVGDYYQTLIVSGSKPQKIILPIGEYQLKLGGNDHYVGMKDKATVSY